MVVLHHEDFVGNYTALGRDDRPELSKIPVAPRSSLTRRELGFPRCKISVNKSASHTNTNQKPHFQHGSSLLLSSHPELHYTDYRKILQHINRRQTGKL